MLTDKPSEYKLPRTSHASPAIARHVPHRQVPLIQSGQGTFAPRTTGRGTTRTCRQKSAWPPRKPRQKVHLVDMGLCALARGDMATVAAITYLIEKAGWRHE
jgi:hypothetical protein